MVEHRLRPQPVHQAVERLGGGALEKGVGLSGGAHAVHDIRPRQVLVHHGAGGVHVVLKVGVHGYGHVRPAPGGHEPGQQGVLVPPVAGQVQPAQQGIVPVQAGDDRPGLVPGAVVDKEHPALRADFSGVHEGSQLVPQPPGGLGKDFLLVEAGDDDVKGIAAHGRDLQKLWAFSSGI